MYSLPMVGPDMSRCVARKVDKLANVYTYWLWFQTCFIFHHIWDVILPIDELIFFKMVKTTNQLRFGKHHVLPVTLQGTYLYNICGIWMGKSSSCPLRFNKDIRWSSSFGASGYVLVVKHSNGNPLQMPGFNGKIIYKWWICHCHVWLPGGTLW